MGLFHILAGNFYPHDEDFGDAFGWFVFGCAWTVLILGQLSSNGLQSSSTFGIVMIPIPFFVAYNLFRKAAACRKLRKEAMEQGTVQHGKIVGVRARTEEQRSSRRRKRITYFTYDVEITSPQTGASFLITSEEYRQAVHHWITSPDILVYTDRSGWKHYLAGFQVKGKRKETFLPEDPHFPYGLAEMLDLLFLCVCIGAIIKTILGL